MTFRDLINEVLIRLREETIDSNWVGDIRTAPNVSDYQKLIGSLVNDSKKNCEGYHDWLVLRETFTLPTVAGTMQYTLGDTTTGAGSSFKVLDVINESNGNSLEQANNDWLNKRVFPTAASGEPTYYAFNGTSQVVATREVDMNVDLYPVPTSVQNINFNIVKPQDNLSSSDDVLKIPFQSVLLGAWARAISERGEDDGTVSGTVAAEASEALHSAILVDSGNTEYERDWYVN